MKVIDIVEQINKRVFVVGDSIAVGIKKAGNADGIAEGGMDSAVVLGFVSTLVKQNNLDGAIVILSSGASNSTFERESGENRSLDVEPIIKQITLLRRAGASVALVGTGSSTSKWITNRFGKYRVNFEKEQVNQRLSKVAQQTGATFLGPLEEYDPSLNSSRGDGIHPYGGYSKLFQAGSLIRE